MGNETKRNEISLQYSGGKSQYMHAVPVYASRWQISLHGAYRLDRDIKRLLLSDSTIEKFCAWVGER